MPVISEVYSRLNIDAVRPLITNLGDKEYRMMSNYVMSEHPDATL